MEKTLIQLHEPKDVKEFVNVAEQCDFDVDVIYNRIVVDAKSFLGVLYISCNPVYVASQGYNAALESICKKYAVSK